MRHHVGSVQRRDGQEIEERQDEVDEDAVVEGIVHRVAEAPQGSDHGIRLHQRGHEQSADDGENEVRDDARQRHPDVSRHGLTVVRFDNRDRPRPPEQKAGS